MCAMEEVFGTDPHCPTHPDFWALASIVLCLDGAAEAGEDVMRERVGPMVDLRSLGYVAHQRAMRRLVRGGADVNDPGLKRLRSAYVDGFVTGCLYAQAR